MTFYEASADGSNGILQATMVRVQFAAATPAPRILEVTTSPRLRTLEGGWLELPPGAGTVVISVKATNAQRVGFTLTPTGTETGPTASCWARTAIPATGSAWSGATPTSRSRPIWASTPTSPGGTADKLLGIAHPGV